VIVNIYRPRQATDTGQGMFTPRPASPVEVREPGSLAGNRPASAKRIHVLATKGPVKFVAGRPGWAIWVSSGIAVRSFGLSTRRASGTCTCATIPRSSKKRPVGLPWAFAPGAADRLHVSADRVLLPVENPEIWVDFRMRSRHDFGTRNTPIPKHGSSDYSGQNTGPCSA